MGWLGCLGGLLLLEQAPVGLVLLLLLPLQGSGLGWGGVGGRPRA